MPVHCQSICGLIESIDDSQRTKNILASAQRGVLSRAECALAREGMSVLMLPAFQLKQLSHTPAMRPETRPLAVQVGRSVLLAPALAQALHWHMRVPIV